MMFRGRLYEKGGPNYPFQMFEVNIILGGCYFRPYLERERATTRFLSGYLHNLRYRTRDVPTSAPLTRFVLFGLFLVARSVYRC